jgi:hypothetical protein
MAEPKDQLYEILPEDQLYERVTKRICEHTPTTEPFALPDPPLFGLSEVIEHVEMRVAKLISSPLDQVESFFFDARGAPDIYIGNDDDDSDDEREEHFVTATAFWAVLRQWYMDWDERIHCRYPEENKRSNGAALIAKMQVVRDAISAAWRAKHPHGLPCHWNVTGCVFVVRYEK